MKKGVITFVFDDGYQHVLEEVVPLLDKNRIPATFAIPLNNDNLELWRKINDRHELAAHGINHQDLRKMEKETLVRELQEPAKGLKATTVVYPGGSHSPEVTAEAAKHYRSARTTTWGFESLPPEDFYHLKTVNWTKDNWSLAKANLFATWAWLSKTWLIETFHKVTNDETDYFYTVPKSDFEKHLKFIKLLPVKNKTIRDVISNYHS